MKLNLKINKKIWLLCLLCTFLYVAVFFQLNFLKYVDEVIAIWAIGYICFRINNRATKDKFCIQTILFLLFMISIGLLSNILLKYQQSWIYVVNDIFTFLKPFVVLLAVYIICEDYKVLSALSGLALGLSKVLSIIIFVVLLVGMMFNLPNIAFYDSWSKFKFLKTYLFFADYPGYLAVSISALIMVHIAEFKEKNTWKYILIDVISLFFTQSGIGFISLFLLVVFSVLKYVKKIKWYHIILLVIGGIIVGYNEINAYLLTSTAARSVLLKYGFITAKRFFPLGSGFSTFGSAEASKHYSRLYSEYNFGAYWGMAQERDVDFLNDSYYPIIIGQFGFIGTILYIWYIYLQFKYINNIKHLWKVKYALIFGLVLLLVMNLGQGQFSGPIGVMYMILFAVYFRRAQQQNI